MGALALARVVIALDTSGLFALLDRRDEHHAEAGAALDASRGPLIVAAGILAEIAYLIEHRLGTAVLDAFLADLEENAFTFDCGASDFGRIRQLVQRYADLPLGFADASVVACAERTGAPILSFDRDLAVVSREGRVSILGDL